MKILSTALIFLFLSLSICPAQEVGIIMGTARHIMQNDVEEGLIKLKEMGIKYIRSEEHTSELQSQ